MTIAALAVGVFVAAWLGTRAVRAYARSRAFLDVPNARSSHTVATPRGGGVAIAAVTLAAIVILIAIGHLSVRHGAGLLAAGVVVAMVGLADDRRHVAIMWRLLGHTLAAVLVLFAMGGAPPVPLFGAVRDLGLVGTALALLYIVWTINLTNFMDGIDGIAAVETLTVCVGGIVLHGLSGAADGYWLVALVLACATLGFLAWNWPPATIFMGDAGSGFLGLMLAATALHAAAIAPPLFWGWTILLGAFFVDATVTLARRALRGDRFVDAHRTHAYQHAAQRWGHRPVTLAVAGLNVGWLLPIAALVVTGAVDGLAGVAVAYAPLAAAALWFGAGHPAGSRARVY